MPVWIMRGTLAEETGVEMEETIDVFVTKGDVFTITSYAFKSVCYSHVTLASYSEIRISPSSRSKLEKEEEED